MRGGEDEIRSRGAELVIVGNGARSFAEAFREDQEIRGPLLVDPELRAYRAAGLRRGRVEALSPRLGWNALRALREGHRQNGVQGDPWQLGGVFVIRPGGELTYRQVSRVAGDHAPLEAILAALEPDAPAVDDAEDLPAQLARALGRGLAALTDPTIVLSFSRPGFHIHALGFDADDLRVDLSGRRCLVTGASSGLGFETALALADLGADVVMLCRSALRGEAAADRIREQTWSRRVSVETCDVSDLESVRQVGERLAASPVDVLVHNAGLLPDERLLTRQGLERCFATHVAGPHLLTRRLRPALERAAAGRVVFVSSGGMYARRLSLEDPQWEERPYDGVVAYAETKRMQVVLAERWARAFGGSRVVVNAMHPGWADTKGVRESLPTFHRLMRPWLRTPAEGADTIVWLAAAEAAARCTGQFFFDRAPRATHLLPFTRETEEEREALWRLCEGLAEEGSGGALSRGAGAGASGSGRASRRRSPRAPGSAPTHR